MLRLFALCLCAGLAVAQKPAPDSSDVSYGPHARNVLDLWKANSSKPTPLVIFIHGGGFRQGDKKGVPAPLLELCLKDGISVAAINYRLSDHATFPAFMLDGARAVQYLRSRAAEWNLDPSRFFATGGSAGAGISLWVGFHDDMADPSNSDPVLRQSTRLRAMGVLGAQSSYDPRFITEHIGKAAAEHPALTPFYGLKPEELNTERAFTMYRDAAPITYLTPDDPPVLAIYSEPHGPLPADAKPGQGIHHPKFGEILKAKMDKFGIECVLKHRDDYQGEPQQQMYRDIVEFFKKHM